LRTSLRISYSLILQNHDDHTAILGPSFRGLFKTYLIGRSHAAGRKHVDEDWVGAACSVLYPHPRIITSTFVCSQGF
jgi:hypothetical protein